MANRYQCWICDKHFFGRPNNADPVSIGVACDECNTKVVLPARIKWLQEFKKGEINNC